MIGSAKLLLRPPVVVPSVNVAIGDSYGGGKVAYIFVSGNTGYVAGETHGIIAATADQSTGIVWAIPAKQYITVPLAACRIMQQSKIAKICT